MSQNINREAPFKAGTSPNNLGLSLAQLHICVMLDNKTEHWPGCAGLRGAAITRIESRNL